MAKRKYGLIPREPVVHMNMRLPKSLHREIRRAAEDKRCSLHAEMLERLRHDPMRLDDRTYQLEWIAMIVKLIWERVNGQQATTQGRQTPQNGREAQERAPEGRDGGKPA